MNIIKKKLKLKKSVIYVLASIVALFVVTILGIQYYRDYKYKQTNEFKFLEKGYSLEDIAIMEEKLSDNQINSFLSLDKNEYLVPILQEKYYLGKNLEAYLQFKEENKDKSLYDIVAIVNVSMHYEWYENVKDADISKENLLLVNKFHKLASDYVPSELVSVSNWYCYGENKVTKETYEAFVKMFEDAKKENISLIINSSYRDYKTQENTFENIKKAKGTEKALQEAARPGFSEHETGLAFDIFSPGNTSTENFHESLAYTWLKEHAYKYGFIERYPQEKEYLTGYHFESWHWRYVGVEVAKIIKDEGITFDEYYAYYIE